MKFLFIDTYYPAFLRYFRKKYPEVSKLSFEKQRKKLLAQYFGTADFYSYNLRRLNYPCEDLIVNDEILQQRWASENRLLLSLPSWLTRIQSLPYAHKLLGRPHWIKEITLAQIAKARPDVLYFQDLTILAPDTLALAKKYCQLVVGQIASPLPGDAYLKQFDLILTSIPYYVDYFKRRKIKSEYFKLGFESRVLDTIGKHKRIYDVAFIGSYSFYHREAMRLFEKTASLTPLNVWGQGIGFYNPFSSFRHNYHGQAWGLSMYKILAQSKIVINRHINISQDYANNMRLYEATGMGAMLITDKKKNLNELFKIGKEIEVYQDDEDLFQKIKYYLSHERELETIARAGQKRTLEEHNYYKRMGELVKIINKYI